MQEPFSPPSRASYVSAGALLLSVRTTVNEGEFIKAVYKLQACVPEHIAERCYMDFAWSPKHQATIVMGTFVRSNGEDFKFEGLLEGFPTQDLVVQLLLLY